MATALLFVDVQHDFCIGSLAVPGALQQLPDLQRLFDEASSRAYSLVVLSQDVHPADHMSFKEQGGPWPPHCVQGTAGAALLLEPRTSIPLVIVQKGMDKTKEAYSAFEGRAGDKTLQQELADRGINSIDICGWALDFCVRATAMDAAALGFKTTVLTKLCSAVDANKTNEILKDLEQRGCQID